MRVLLRSQHVHPVLKMNNTNKATSSEFIIRHNHEAAVKINIFMESGVKRALPVFRKNSPLNMEGIKEMTE